MSPQPEIPDQHAPDLGQLFHEERLREWERGNFDEEADVRAMQRARERFVSREMAKAQEEAESTWWGKILLGAGAIVPSLEVIKASREGDAPPWAHTLGVIVIVIAVLVTLFRLLEDF